MGDKRLLDQLAAFDRAMAGRMTDADRDTLAQARRELEDAGALRRVLRPGDTAPDFAAPDQNGAAVRLGERLALGPVVVLFFRGGWCPFCTLTLRAWQDALPALHDAGGDLLAVSPQGLDQCCRMAERDLLAYSVLSDRGGAIADAYGVGVELPPRARALYLRLGHDLPRINGDGTWRMPLPATFVAGRDGRIALAHAEVAPDTRLDPGAAIAAVRALMSDNPAAAQPL